MREIHDLSKAEENVETVLKILPEYSEKLNIMFERFENHRQTGRFYMFIIALSMAFGLIVGMAAYNEYLKEIKNYLPYLITALLSLVLIAVLFLRVRLVQFERQRDLKRNMLILLPQMERVIRLASQLEERSEPEFGKRLELGLRIAEAEGILHMVEKAVYAYGDYREYRDTK